MTADQIAAELNRVFLLTVPEAVLALAACALFLGGTFRANRHLWAGFALVALASAGLALYLAPDVSLTLSVSPIIPDRLALFTRVVALVGGGVLVLFSWNEVDNARAADYHACLLLATAGLSLTGIANDLITLFVALELISIPTYVLLYLLRTDAAAQEAAVKYFLLSVFSSALLLFGFSYLYGLSGTTNLAALMETLVGRDRPDVLPVVAAVALIMVVAGLCFKITAVPFHWYAPDVYQGAPFPVVALLAFLPKAAGFIALVRVLGFLWVGDRVNPGLALSVHVPILFWILAIMTMTLGNVLALLQDNLKRLLAYSSVAHAGYMLIGLAVAPELGGEDLRGGVAAMLFYLVAYSAMTVGAFAVLNYLSTPERPVGTVDDLAGLSRSHPGMALIMAVFLFSLIGLPLTAGFFGKLMLFFGALAVPGAPERAFWFRLLALAGALNAAVGAWYYLRIVAVMYLRDSTRPLAVGRGWPLLAAIGICAVLTVGLGVYPAFLVNETAAAARPEAALPAGPAHTRSE